VASHVGSLTSSLPGVDDRLRIEFPAGSSIVARAARAAARPLLSFTLALPRYRALYRRAAFVDHPSFHARALDVLGIRVRATFTHEQRIPRDGPVIVVANHPHGLLDGLVMWEVVQRARPDVRILANRLLAVIPEMADLCLFVDPFGGAEAGARSRAGLRRALAWLREGKTLVVFPAGEVAHRRARGRIVDSAWSETVGRLSLHTGATIVPAFIEGRNSDWFYRAGRLHPRLRTALLPRELLAKQGSRVHVTVGDPFRVNRDPGGEVSAAAVVAEGRRAVDALSAPPEVPAQRPPARRSRRDPAEDVDRLVPAERLLSAGELDVYCVPASRIPAVLAEIGRRREEAFHAVGEGTGRSLDIDEFDRHYLHLFAWQRTRRELVGAYRIGPTEEILRTRGVGGLYTSTLFRFDERLIAALPPAFELGRSFVRAEYQRTNALTALWKGIAQLVLRHPRYRVLFGPVSISRRYGDSSQQLLQVFLLQNHRHHELASLVHALHPPSSAPIPEGVRAQALSEVADLDRLVRTLEADGKGIPILLRQYLRLNAKLLGFNIDPAFSDALDALMMVDLADVDPSILLRYFGRDGARQVLARAGHTPPVAA
jgi:putative hemolysin